MRVRKRLWLVRTVMALTQMVAPKQKFHVQNTDSGEQQECRVVSVKKELTGPAKVAVEFIRPAPSFWHLAFPPADWPAKS
jgi:hypothetical protein